VLAPAAGIRDLESPTSPGARYTIPARDDCRACHEGAPVPVLGFSALQLSPDRDPSAPRVDTRNPGVDLSSLTASGRLRGLPLDLLARPPRIEAANATERAALGYLHGNCGHCHNDDGPLAVLEMTLSQRAGVQAHAGPVQRSLIGVPSEFRIQGGAARVSPGQPDASVVALRMRSNDPLQRMPPLGTSVPDAAAVSLIARWIEGLSVH
jgi:hypothetical protein